MENNIVDIKEPIKSLSEFINLLETEKELEYDNEDIRLYFRGEEDKFPEPCCPSFFRKYNEKLIEDKVYYRTLRRQPDEFIGLSNLDILAKMQHYGIPTRFLDITSNPLVALFFAVMKGDGKDGCIYVFKAKVDENILSYDSDRALLISTLAKLSNEEKKDVLKYCETYPDERITPTVISDEESSILKYSPQMKNSLRRFIYECERERHAFHQNHRVNPNDLTKIYFAKPKFSNERLKAQDGLFILFGLGQKKYKDKIYRIVIPADYKKKYYRNYSFLRV